MSIPDTLLVISPQGIPPYSARGVKQTLDPIDQAKNLRRTVNGQLISLTPSQFRKYRSTITCDDMNVPAIDGVFPGDQVVVSCVEELSYVTIGGSPQRTVVSGSSRVDGNYTFYRPQLTMLITDTHVETDEWGAKVGWRIDLEEV